MPEKDDVYAVIHSRTTADGGFLWAVNGPYYSIDDANQALQSTVASPHSLHAQMASLAHIEAVANGTGNLPVPAVEAAKLFLKIKNP